MVIEAEEIGGNGTGTLAAESESQAQLDEIGRKLSGLTRPDGSVVHFTKQELTLLKQILSTGTEKYREETIWRMCSFLNKEEAHFAVSAYYEAVETYMDTSFNIAMVFAQCSINYRGNFSSNLISFLGGTLQNGKWPQGQGDKNYAAKNQRDTISR
jgi:hypothetical protein